VIIRAKNFLSWEDLEFEVNKGVTLIQGFNHDDNTPEGSGKSAILNALAWGLFGKIPKDANVDDVIREGASKCQVEIELDGFSVFRSRKPNDLCIISNNKEVRGKDARETQAEIEKLVGMSFDSFCQSIYFAQNYPNKFVTANQENKGKILSEILDLEQFDRARKKANDQLKMVKDDLLVSTKDVERYRTLKLSEEESRDSFKELISQFEVDKTNKIKALFGKLKDNEAEAEAFVMEFEANKKSDLKKIKTEIKALEDSETKLAKQAQTIQLKMDEIDLEAIEEKQEALDQQKEDLEANKTSTKVKLGSIDMIIQQQEKRQRDLKNAKKELESLTPKIKDKKWGVEGAKSDLEHDEEVLAKALKALKNPSKENCPTCGQSWDGNLSHYEKEVEKAKKEKARTEAMLAGYIKDIKDMTEQQSALEQVIVMLTKEVSEQEVPDTNKLNKDLERIEKVLSVLKSDRKALDEELKNFQLLEFEWKKIQNDIGNLYKQRSKLEDQYNTLKELNAEKNLERFEQRAAQLEKEIEAEDAKEPTLLENKLKESKAKLKSYANDLNAAEGVQIELNKRSIQLEALKDGYKEVKAYAFQNVLNQLTRKANNYLSELFEQPIKIHFQNVDMKIDVSVAIDGKERPLGLYSGGQFRRIALAVDLALSDITCSRNSNKLNLMILDEYCKDLSEVSMEKVLKLLQSRKGSTILIEHNSIFKAIVNNVFDVELINKVSRRVQ
jgi:DNA repair protein SbcC/Rad50